MRPDPERHGALGMTEAARPILRGEETDHAAPRHHERATADAARPPRRWSREEDAPLLSALKAKRRALAEAAALPAYIIFPDRTLIEMAEQRPANLDAMARISGVGAKKLEKYGSDFLSVITGASEEMHPSRRKLAGREAGDVYDQLLQVQADLARGPDGHDKPLSCSTGLLSKVAQMHRPDADALERLLGERRAERFGSAFLDVLHASG